MTDPFITNLLSFGLPVHCVIDGAIVPDIEKHLERHEIEGRPLFRDTMDRETIIAGPWLVSSGSSHAAVSRSVVAASDAGQGVFWLGVSDSEVLFRHLRKLGAARMPDGRIVYFRHYDSDVLAAIVPLVNEDQAAHLFGPAHVIAFVGGSGDGATVERPEGLQGLSSGPIAFEEWQIEKLDDRQRELSRHRIADVLRRSFPDKLNGKDDLDLLQDVERHETDANRAGLTSERAISQWAHLSILSGGQVNDDVKLRRFLQKDGPVQANGNLDANYEYLLIKCKAYVPTRGVKQITKREFR